MSYLPKTLCRPFLPSQVSHETWSQSYDREFQRQRCKKISNATSRLVRFDDKNTFLHYEKNALAYFYAGFVEVNSEVVGWARK
jgi:hypothetical protein